MILALTQWSFCGIDHVALVVDLATYQKTQDPEFCDSLVHKIDEFNLECAPEMEIPDCG